MMHTTASGDAASTIRDKNGNLLGKCMIRLYHVS